MKWVDKIKQTKFDFARHGRWFIIAPAVILLVGIILFCCLGFNLGLDFTGGAIATITKTETVTKDYVTAKMDEYNIKYTITEERSTSGSTTFAVRFNATSNTERNNEILQELNEYFGDDYVSGDSIQASTSNEKVMTVFWSVLAACIGLMIYMLFRFKITAGITTLLALAHDVLMICALMAILRIEINTSFIAAILTVIAYSINNSLVVFDRVRTFEKNNTENYTLDQMLNKAISSTLVRSILTVTTTLATLLVLTIISLIMHLPTLIQFALPIILGLVAGTYSSMFLIAPMYRQFEGARLVRKQRKQDKVK